VLFSFKTKTLVLKSQVECRNFSMLFVGCRGGKLIATPIFRLLITVSSRLC